MRLVACFLASLLLATAPTPATGAPPQRNAPAERRELTVGGSFLDTIAGSWIGVQPQFARKPTLDELKAALGGHLPEDFGLAFSCWVQPSGALRDCHTTMTAPGGIDGAALMRAMQPLVTLTTANAHEAVTREYRLSVHAALQTYDAKGRSAHCYPPYCVANDPPPPPPPPPQAKDPLLRAAIKQASDCFWPEFERSSDLRFKAEEAVHEGEAANPESVRSAVMNYVNSRTALKQCIALLEDAERDAVVSKDDQAAVDAALQSMKFNYAGQTRYELAILIGLVDKRAGEEELSFPDP